MKLVLVVGRIGDEDRKIWNVEQAEPLDPFEQVR